jgi:hypothetical protein
MKRYISILLALITVFAVLAVSACAKPPTAEMESAAAAITRAENEPNVVDYAENTLRQAQSSLAAMNDAANNKQYDEAKLLAQETIDLAERAISEARTGEARAAEEAAAAETKNGADAENLINSVKASITEAEQAFANAQAKNIRLDISAISYEIETAKELLQDADASLAAQAFQEAEDSAEEARSAISKAMTLIADAVRENSRKK